MESPGLRGRRPTLRPDSSGYFAPGVVFFAAAAVAAGIFVLDSLNDVDVVVADLYVVVVLMVSRVLRPRDLFLVTAGCIVLAVVSHVISPGNPWRATPLVNLLFACATIALTAFMVFRNVSAEGALSQEPDEFGATGHQPPLMTAFSNWPVSRKLTVAFAAVVAVIFVSGATVYSRVGVLDETLNWHLRTDHTRDALDVMRAAILDQQTDARDYLTAGDTRDLALYRKAGDDFAAALQNAKGFTAGVPAQERRLDEVNALVKAWQGIAEREITLMAKPETRQDAHALFASGAGSVAMDRIIAKVDEAEAAEAALALQNLATLRQAYASVYRVVILSGIASIVIVMLMDLILRRGVTVPVRRMTSAMAALAKGDTGVDVPGAGRNDEIGAMAAAVEIFRDRMIERNRAEEALREQANEIGQLNRELTKRAGELERSNQELESFAYSISHDLRAPLRHVVGYAELLKKQASSVLDEKSRRYTETILESAKRLGNLIDDLLAFSRVGRSETNKTRVSLEQLVKEAIVELGPDTKGRDIIWKIGILPVCYGDRSMLRLAIVNLLANAIKFTSIRARAEIQIGCVEREHEVEMFVKDNGAGFDMQYVDKLFGVFQRLHLPEQFEGTGIGLATVRRIIEHHGGNVRAEGHVDEGAAFYFTLPRAQ